MKPGKKVTDIYMLVHPYWIDFSYSALRGNDGMRLPILPNYLENMGLEGREKEISYSKLFKAFGREYGSFILEVYRNPGAVLVFVAPKLHNDTKHNILGHLKRKGDKEAGAYLDYCMGRIGAEEMMGRLSKKQRDEVREALYSEKKRVELVRKMVDVRSNRFLRLADFARRLLDRRAVFMRATYKSPVDGKEAVEILRARGFEIRNPRIHSAGEQFDFCRRANLKSLIAKGLEKPVNSNSFFEVAEKKQAIPKEAEVVVYKTKSDYLSGANKKKFLRIDRKTTKPGRRKARVLR